MRFFWHKREEPASVEIHLSEISMDAQEREDLYFLLHALDGIEVHRRVKEPLDNVRRVHEIMAHFAEKRVQLPWDVERLKAMIEAYEARAA